MSIEALQSRKQWTMQDDAGAQGPRSVNSRKAQAMREWSQGGKCAAQLPSDSRRSLPDTPIAVGAVSLRALSRQRRPIAVSSNSSRSRPDQLADLQKRGVKGWNRGVTRYVRRGECMRWERRQGAGRQCMSRDRVRCQQCST